ncbi:uncharacterized protein F4812DRAFT_462309 [Daldinia caldariorum]|uniref:uncharacterized protein n=1 Tax=Daldinia caldariorum TaxID=326644 RepID=UPI0020080E29|nr:uncharacterized protein F4812DRAFT_462309 [Daldinia caldariorum]KAI1464988.1 hypothetical protein F4812DRAFT_462309 [Daldinia caldariorum]
MPPSNRRRQPQDAQPWKGSPKSDRRSMLFSRGSLRRRNMEGDFIDTTPLRRRQIVSRGHDDGFRGFRGGHDSDHESDSDSDDDYLKHDPGDSSSDESDDDEYDTIGDIPQQTTQLATPSLSGSIVTLTALPSQTTTLKIMTTTPISQLSSTSLPLYVPVFSAPPTLGKAVPPQQGKEEDQKYDYSDLVPSPTSQPTTAFTGTVTTEPTFVPVASDTANDSDNGGKHKWHNDPDFQKQQQGVLNPTAEHLLIAAGAIGAFILFCFIGWVIYRVFKKTKGQSIGIGGGMGFIDKFNERRRGPVDDRALYVSNEAPPLYEKGEYGTMQSGTFYGPNKVHPSGNGSITHSVVANSEPGALRQLPDSNPPLASVVDQYAVGNGVAAYNGDINMTMRSQVTQPYYNESELVRQPPEIYSAPKRAGTRTSEISSISSGFGDGDIIVPPPSGAEKPAPVQVEENATARDSWISRPGERRETVYTEASEDRPARFRSITSWVNQQAGRAKRAHSRAQERGEVPVMPAVPGEMSTIRQTAYR